MTKRKLYWILMPSFALIAIISIFLLPQTKKHYSFAIIIVFWIVYYYTLGYIERKKAKDQSE
ncbi:hypothetical protein [Bacillus massiliigorillae]|uniref:hypothetical protein n=1 Tax=Bacillus massiliigorillae TaxID=1243664 RepID=UPI00039AA4F8|nr:hypothetical protein [Bacillus massiliigorillae]